MGCYLKVKNQPFYLARGKMVERKSQATYYSSSYAARTMMLRWYARKPKVRLEIRIWATDELWGINRE